MCMCFSFSFLSVFECLAINVSRDEQMLICCIDFSFGRWESGQRQQFHLCKFVNTTFLDEI